MQVELLTIEVTNTSKQTLLIQHLSDGQYLMLTDLSLANESPFGYAN